MDWPCRLVPSRPDMHPSHPSLCLFPKSVAKGFLRHDFGHEVTLVLRWWMESVESEWARWTR